MKKILSLTSSLLLVAALATPAESADEYSVSQKTLAAFNSTATTLTPQQKAQVKAAVDANPSAEKFICTGIRFESAPLSENIVVRKRAKAACEYAQQLNPALSTWFQNKPTKARSYAGKVLLTVKSPAIATDIEQETASPAPTPRDPTPVQQPEQASSGQLNSLILSLTVESEYTVGYDRSLFRHWVDEDGDGCDTRKEVLIQESVTPVTVGSACSISGGKWVSAYDLQETTDSSTFDVDHMVPLKEAWDSGAWNWSSAARQAFANDLTYAHSLIAVSASSNRSKSDRDPTDWLPTNSEYRCEYTVAWVQVKARWKLSIDSAEKSKLLDLAADCGNKPLEFAPEARATPTPTPSPAQTPGSSGILAGRAWTISISGPDSVSYGEPFSLRISVKDFDGNPLQGKIVSYTSWQFSGSTQPTDSLGNTDLEVSDPLPSGYRLVVGTTTIRVSSDFANASKTIKVLASASPSPTPEPTPADSSDSNSTSYRLVTPGAFCAQTDAGTQGKSSSGVIYTCKTSSTENRLRWRR